MEQENNKLPTDLEALVICTGQPRIELYNEDWRDVLPRYESNWFDLAIVDPPYGIGSHKEQGLGDKRTGSHKRTKSKWEGGKWDNQRPGKEYFEELFRISKNQMIFGGNYFADLLPAQRCWIIWDKVQRVDNADAELIWTSFDTSCRIFDFAAQKLMGFMNPKRFHPTEKPVDLYRWLLQNYANEGDKILDTHLGSGSSAIACYEEKFDLVATEIDTDYFEAMTKRVNQHKSQGKLF